MQAWQVREDRNSSELNKWLLAGGWAGSGRLGALTQRRSWATRKWCPASPIVWVTVTSGRCGACHHSNAVEYSSPTAAWLLGPMTQGDPHLRQCSPEMGIGVAVPRSAEALGPGRPLGSGTARGELPPAPPAPREHPHPHHCPAPPPDCPSPMRSHAACGVHTGPSSIVSPAGCCGTVFLETCISGDDGGAKRSLPFL